MRAVVVHEPGGPDVLIEARRSSDPGRTAGLGAGPRPSLWSQPRRADHPQRWLGRRRHVPARDRYRMRRRGSRCLRQRSGGRPSRCGSDGRDGPSFRWRLSAIRAPTGHARDSGRDGARLADARGDPGNVRYGVGLARGASAHIRRFGAHSRRHFVGRHGRNHDCQGSWRDRLRHHAPGREARRARGQRRRSRNDR